MHFYKPISLEMKTIFITTLFLFLTFQAHSQTLAGKVVDANTGEPIAYVNIGVVGTSIGTITDINGKFQMEVSGLLSQAQVRFTMIGYAAKSFTLEELAKNENSIQLKEEPVQLAEVIIRPGSKIKKVGTTSCNTRNVCGWGGTNFGKGHELGLKLDLGAVPVRFQKIHFRLSKQSFDTSLFRLHIRSLENNLPSVELLTENIILTVTKKSGWVDFDLSKYNLVFKGDVVLSLEWVNVVGINKDRLKRMNGSKEYTPIVLFNTKKNHGSTYIRRGSEDRWKSADDGSPTFYVTVQ